MNTGFYVQTTHGKVGQLTKTGEFIVKNNEEVLLETKSKKEAIKFLEKHNDKSLVLEETPCEILFNKNKYLLYSNQITMLDYINVRIYQKYNKHITIRVKQDEMFFNMIECFKNNNVIFYLIKN